MEIKDFRGSKKLMAVRAVLFVIFAVGVTGCMAVLLPQVRFFIISLAQNTMTFYSFNINDFNEVMLKMSRIGVIVYGGLFVITIWIPNILGFFAGNYAVSRGLLALPVIFGFVIVTVFGVNLIYVDEWALLHFIKNVMEKGIHFQDFFMPHNEHRIFFPKILFLASALLTGFNVKANMYISWFFVTVTYIVYLVYLKRTIKCETSADRLKRLFLGLIIGFYCFNLVQVENTIFGFQVGFFMVVVFSVLCFYFFYRSFTENINLYLFFSMIAGFIASFSSLHGLFVFPVIFGVLLLLYFSGEKIRAKYILTVILTAVPTYVIYFYGIESLSNKAQYSVKQFFQMIIYFLTAVGNPFTFLLNVPAVIAGTLLVATGIAVTIYLIRKKKTQEYIFPLCLLYFGYAFCAAIALGRSTISYIDVTTTQPPIMSRYTTFSLFVIIGQTIIAYTELIVHKKIDKLIAVTINLVRSLLVVLFLLQFVFLAATIYSSRTLQLRQTDLLNYRIQTKDRLNYIISPIDPDTAHEYIEFLEKNRWSVFSRKQGFTPRR
jgi:hypothetical protein